MQLDPLIRILADGAYHSGVELGEHLGVSRTAVWNYISKLQDLGIPLETLKGKGYRVPGGLDLLDVDFIQSQLTPGVKQVLGVVEVHSCIDSTNQYLLQKVRVNHSDNRTQVVLAEHQLAGRGRRGRRWFGAYARNICLSLSYTFEQGFSVLEGLSLAIGLFVSDVLNQHGLDAVRLKWPNDIWVGDRKLGGILIELSGEQAGPCQVVIGLGLNVSMPQEGAAMAIEQPWVSMVELQPGSISRNRLAADLINGLLEGLVEFEQHGFKALKERWIQLDALRNREVVLSGSGVQQGICRGVNARGHLLLETDSGIAEVFAGEVSLRPL